MKLISLLDNLNYTSLSFKDFVEWISTNLLLLVYTLIVVALLTLIYVMVFNVSRLR